jgi:hypothetical protein
MVAGHQRRPTVRQSDPVEPGHPLDERDFGQHGTGQRLYPRTLAFLVQLIEPDAQTSDRIPEQGLSRYAACGAVQEDLVVTGLEQLQGGPAWGVVDVQVIRGRHRTRRGSCR